MVEKFTFTDDPITYRGQGVTTDGKNWYFSGTNALDKADGNFSTITRDNSAIDPALANPFAGAPRRPQSYRRHRLRRRIPLHLAGYQHPRSDHWREIQHAGLCDL